MRLLAPIFIITLALVVGVVMTGNAQRENGLPQPTVTVSFLQTRLHLTSQVPVSIVIENPGDIPLDTMDLNIFAPDFLQITEGECNVGETIGVVREAPVAFHLGSLPAHQVTFQRLCFYLDQDLAISGTYQLLFSLIYHWDQNTSSISIEKEIQVDLIGTDFILGIPLAFAGVILPGVILLMVLRWFRVPWVENLSTEDRVIFGVVISLGLLGLITWFSTHFVVPGRIQQLALYQQVTISQLAWYIGIGLGTGVLIGGVYRVREKRKAHRAAGMQISPSDTELVIIRKMLYLNPDYNGGKVSFRNKKDNHQIHGWHYCDTGEVIEVLGKFRLVISALPNELGNKVHRIVDKKPGFSHDRNRILRVVELLLAESPAGALVLAEPVIEIDTNGHAISNPEQFHKTLEKSLYGPVTIIQDQSQALLDVTD